MPSAVVVRASWACQWQTAVFFECSASAVKSKALCNHDRSHPLGPRNRQLVTELAVGSQQVLLKAHEPYID